MKTVTRYVSDDGIEWQDQQSAETRDKMVADVADAMSELKQTPGTGNWEGYVQQSAAAVQRCREKLFEIANVEGVLKWWIASQKADHGKTDADIIAFHPSWMGRVLDGQGPLSAAYSRLCAIDRQHREWDQPYYAQNPGEGKDVCVG